jgi:hypothetical protein
MAAPGLLLQLPTSRLASARENKSRSCYQVWAKAGDSILEGERGPLGKWRAGPITKLLEGSTFETEPENIPC